MNNFETFKFTQDGSIGVLTFTREKQLNALNKKVLAELEILLNHLEQEALLKVLILTGSGKAFVAGADIKELQNLSSNEALELSQFGQRLFLKLEEARYVSIAAINGFALGGGLELALSCDISICSREAKVGLPEVTLGLIPGYGGTQRLGRQIGKNRAQYMIFSGTLISAEKAFRLGLFADLYEPDQLLIEAQNLAKKISRLSFSAMGLAKKVIQKGLDHNLNEGLNLEAAAFSKAFEHPDHKEGLSAFIEKRTAHFEGE